MQAQVSVLAVLSACERMCVFSAICASEWRARRTRVEIKYYIVSAVAAAAAAAAVADIHTIFLRRIYAHIRNRTATHIQHRYAWTSVSSETFR